MDTFPLSAVTEIGFVQKVHGVAGAIALTFEPEWETYLEESPVLLTEIDGILVPWPIEEDGLRITTSRSAIVKLKWINDAVKAKQLVGKKLFLPVTGNDFENMPTGINGWVGYSVTGTDGQFSGTLVEIDDFAGNIVFTINCGGRNILIPFHEELLIDLNEEAKSIIITIPEGLLDSDSEEA